MKTLIHFLIYNKINVKSLIKADDVTHYYFNNVNEK